MTDGFLSQDEIDSLLGGNSDIKEDKLEDLLSDIEKDLLGEIGNISMGSASTALSQIVNQPVNITTPIVTVTTLEQLRKEFETPYISLDIKYIKGIIGENLLVIKTDDAATIANLMMGGDGKLQGEPQLGELEISAVQEAMNQMIGSSATAMATMLGISVDISPPTASILDGNVAEISPSIKEKEPIVKVSFRMTIGDLIDSNIMQVLPMDTAKSICGKMMGEASALVSEPISIQEEVRPQQTFTQQTTRQENTMYQQAARPVAEVASDINYISPKAPVEVSKASFMPLAPATSTSLPSNIDLILDVNLDISVVLGRTKKSIKEILALGTGALIELDKLAEEPVEILVNGKKIAFGEVVVIDENFGVRITSIISSEERVRTLGK